MRDLLRYRGKAHWAFCTSLVGILYPLLLKVCTLTAHPSGFMLQILNLYSGRLYKENKSGIMVIHSTVKKRDIAVPVSFNE